MMTKILLAVALLGLLTGCTGRYPYTRNHTLEPQAYYADRYSCLHEARQGFVFGHPLFVMGQQNRLYLPCMQARGWYIPAPKP